MARNDPVVDEGLLQGYRSTKISGRKQAGRILTLVLLLVALVVLAALPNFLNLYWMRLISYVFQFAVLAQAINLIAGYTGYPAFGNVVFFGLGSYGTAVAMTDYGANLAAGLIVSVLVCIVTALMFGPPLLRLRGHYFAIATVGLNEAIKAIVSNTTDLTGGGMGLSLPLPPGRPPENAVFFYYCFFALMLAALVLTWWFSVSRLGHQCRAIRDNELKAEAMGIRTTRVKTLVWTLSAALTGVAGGIHAYWLSYVEPPTAFDMTIAVKSFVIFLLGGAGTVLGPIVAAFFVELASTLAWTHLLSFHLGLMGLIIIGVVLFMPDGFAEFLRERKQLLFPGSDRGKDR